MIKQGEHTQHGIYAESPLSSLSQFEEFVKGKKVLDLGAGKGFIVDKLLSMGANAWGIEIEKELFDEAITPQRMILGDFMTIDFSKWDVIYYYMNGCAKQAELFDKIAREFKGYIIVYTG